MNAFIKSEFIQEGAYLFYGAGRKFIARFKYSNGPVTKAKMISILVKKYSQEEYFSRVDKEAPLGILRNDGILEFNLKNKKSTIKI
jgi:hypothetical protein